VGDAGVTAPETEPDERRLVEAAQRDPACFGELYERHFERVYAYVARRVPGRDVAEDVTSEVFHRALAGIRAYEWKGIPFAAWLFRIAAHAIADRGRRAGRELADADADEKPDPAEPPDYAEAERAAAVQRLVAQLPPDQQRVIRMRFAEERSIREVAAALGRSEGAVKQLQFRALETLRGRARDEDV
jgi:RNA polymerase sigma-70 factor (ECF subfamily)